MTDSFRQLPGLHYSRCTFTLRLLQDAQFPRVKGSMFRGAFGHAFRSTVCFTRMPVCNDCSLKSQCSYFRIFETEVPGNAVWFLRGIKKTPHPFIFSTHHLGEQEYRKDDLIPIHVTIFGDPVQLFPFFTLAFLRMGDIGVSVRKHRFTLESVEVHGYAATPLHLYRDGKIHPLPVEMLQNIPFPTQGGEYPEKVQVQLNSHLALQKAARVITRPVELTPDVLLNAMARRYYGLLHLFGNPPETGYLNPLEGAAPSLDATNLWYDSWDRYSNRFGGKMTFGGFLGSFSINLTSPLQWQLLQACSITALGKNTVFGSGQYTLKAL